LSEQGDFAEAHGNLKEAEEILTIAGRSAFVARRQLRCKQIRFTSNADPKRRNAESRKRSRFKSVSRPQYINFATALMIQGLILNQAGKTQEAASSIAAN
jgi:hypothetical protein